MKENWTYKKLGEVGIVVTGSTPSTKDDKNYSSSDVCFYKPSDLDADKLTVLSHSEFHISQYAFGKARKLPKDSVLTTCIGIIGKVGILDKEATCNQQINAIIPNIEIITPRFLGYSLIAIKSVLTEKANAPVVPLLNKSQFCSVPIPIPPLSEQEAIVKELDTLNDILAKKRAQVAEYDQLQQSLFYTMFGDPVTNEKGWQVKKLGEIGTAITGITYSPNDVSSEGTIVLRSSNIQKNLLDFSDVVRVNKEIKDKYIAKEGDILMCSRNGSFRLVGKTAKITRLHEDMTWGAFMTIIRSDYNPYLLQYFRSPAFREQLTTAKTTTVNQITIGMLNAVSIPLPPLALQQEFAKKVEAIEALKEKVNASIREVETLLNSRMDYYFG